MTDKRGFRTIIEKNGYSVPLYEVQDNIGIVEVPDQRGLVTFVRGDKRPDVTEEEYQEAVKTLNSAAKYTGLDSFDSTNQSFVNTGSIYAIWLSDGGAGKRKEYEEAKKVIERYLKPVDRLVGSLHEHYLSVLIHDLKLKNADFPSARSEEAIKHLEYALWNLEERARERVVAGIQGTHQK